MSFRIRIYDAETEALIGECDADDILQVVNALPCAGVMLRTTDGRLLGFAQPKAPTWKLKPIDHSDYQARVRFGYRSVRPPQNDDLSSV